MAVQFDQVAFFTFSGSGAISPATWDFLHGDVIDIGAGANGTANRALWFAVSFVDVAAGSVSGVSATHNGSAMTLIDTFTGPGNSDMFAFGIIAPALGANNIVLSWTGSGGTNIPAAALSVVGADQSAIATTFKNVAKNTGSGTPGTPATVTVTSATGDMVVAIHETVSNFGSGTSLSGTLIGFYNPGGVSAAAANYDNGASPSVPVTFTTAGGGFASMGMDIAAVGGGGGGGGFFARDYYDMIGRPNV